MIIGTDDFINIIKPSNKEIIFWGSDLSTRLLDFLNLETISIYFYAIFAWFGMMLTLVRWVGSGFPQEFRKFSKQALVEPPEG